MNSPDDDVARLLSCGEAMKLAACSHLAMRVYLHLFWGEDSERPGLGRCRPGTLADILKSSRRAVVAALDELASVGLIEWSDGEAIASRVGFNLRYWPKDWPNAVSWSRTILQLRDGFIANKLRETLADRIKAASQAASKVASKAASQAASEVIVRESIESFESKNSNPQTTTPPASAPQAEPVELDLQPQKPKDRTLTPTQEKAIAKRKTAEQAMREWNDIMAKVGNARIVKLDAAHVAVLSAAYALLGRPDAYPYTLTPFAGLLTWAAEDSPWYGKGQRNNGGERHVHTALSWCSRDHLARAVAAHEAWAASKELTPSVCLEVNHAA